ncbi:hypothetical protein FN924_02735 [Radiobacillus deserti]|uniref:Uncharacterized protein n=1 Tax=Radiobacillus deserti TaxID=2594883 RepID=A0A516KCS7_9BACI|nr:hypothetical protein FN924_02735 [Radiobacillus deserti]
MKEISIVYPFKKYQIQYDSYKQEEYGPTPILEIETKDHAWAYPARKLTSVLVGSPVGIKNAYRFFI